MIKAINSGRFVLRDPENRFLFAVRPQSADRPQGELQLVEDLVSPRTPAFMQIANAPEGTAVGIAQGRAWNLFGTEDAMPWDGKRLFRRYIFLDVAMEADFIANLTGQTIAALEPETALQQLEFGPYERAVRESVAILGGFALGDTAIQNNI